jgi:hypothetical protein
LGHAVTFGEGGTKSLLLDAVQAEIAKVASPNKDGNTGKSSEQSRNQNQNQPTPAQTQHGDKHHEKRNNAQNDNNSKKQSKPSSSSFF